MFSVVLLEDTFVIAPHLFGQEELAISLEIRKKYVNHVIKDIGLCVALFEFVSIGSGMVYPGNGSAHVQVKFRMVMFRPFLGEVLIGRVKSSNISGIQVSLEFFDDIHIPPSLMLKPSKFDKDSSIWFWQYGEELFFLGYQH